MKNLKNNIEMVNNSNNVRIALGRMHYGFIPKPENMDLGTWDTCKNDILNEKENIIKNYEGYYPNDFEIMNDIICKFKDSLEHQLVIDKLLEDTFDEENAKKFIMEHIDDWNILSETEFKKTGMMNKLISCKRYTFIMTEEFEETIVVLNDIELAKIF